MRVFYWGARGGHAAPGHRLWQPGAKGGMHGVLPSDAARLPMALRAPDGTMCPSGGQEQSVCRVSHVDGWTVVACWDRSADSRPNSNAAFIVEGEVSFGTALLHAAAAFPEVVARIQAAGELEEWRP